MFIFLGVRCFRCSGVAETNPATKPRHSTPPLHLANYSRHPAPPSIPASVWAILSDPVFFVNVEGGYYRGGSLAWFSSNFVPSTSHLFAWFVFRGYCISPRYNGVCSLLGTLIGQWFYHSQCLVPLSITEQLQHPSRPSLLAQPSLPSLFMSKSICG